MLLFLGEPPGNQISSDSSQRTTHDAEDEVTLINQFPLPSFESVKVVNEDLTIQAADLTKIVEGLSKILVHCNVKKYKGIKRKYSGSKSQGKTK